MNGIVAADTQSCNEHSECEELHASCSAFRCPDVWFSLRFQPRPTWERIPCPVSSSVPRPMMKPIIARRPFHCSAKEEKPNFASSMDGIANMTICNRLLSFVAKQMIRVACSPVLSPVLTRDFHVAGRSEHWPIVGPQA